MNRTFDPRALAADTAETMDLALTRALEHLAEQRTRRLDPDPAAVAGLAALGGPLPEEGEPAPAVLDLLDRVGRPATVLNTSPRFFGFVCGGTLPVALGAQWMAAAWDQNAAMRVLSPVASAVEDVAREWLVDLLRLPPEIHCSFVTGTTTADVVALLAARQAVLERHGWNAARQGMAGAPAIRAVVSDQVHTTMLRALRVIGIGQDQVIRVPVDQQGRMIPAKLPSLDQGPTILCVQAGNVDSGSFDPLRPVIERAREAGAWVHLDGAFGLWAAACPELAHLVDGHDLADSWACDGHKWLNVPYDSAMAFVRNREPLRETLKLKASYLVQDLADPTEFTLELSRRARGIEVWAALRNLGRQGVAGLVRQSCAMARRFAQHMSEAGFEVLNEVVLNQVLVSFGSDERTAEVMRRVREEGTAWFGGTRWRGRAAMRVSVSCWATEEEDIDRSAEAALRVARELGGGSRIKPTPRVKAG